MKRILFIILILCCAYLALNAQQSGAFLNNTTRQDMRVTIQRNVNFQDALKVIEMQALREERRNIINISSFNAGIPVEINNVYWKDALDLLVKAIGVRIETRPGSYLISDYIDEKTVETIKVGDKMIRITSTFLSVNKQILDSMGIDWTVVVDGEVSVDFRTAELVEGGILDVNRPEIGGINPKFGLDGKKNISIESLLRFIVTNSYGAVLARPSVILLDSAEGYVQVGQDFSVMKLDPNNNTVHEFFSTGIILRSKPTIITEDDFEAIHLTYQVEKSDAIPSTTTTIINKNLSTGSILLYDGEETVIAGLVDKDYLNDEGGVPFLRKLPWWLGGFLFRYTSERVIDREIVVILKAEIQDNAMERIKQRHRIRDEVRKRQNEFKDMLEEVDFGN